MSDFTQQLRDYLVSTQNVPSGTLSSNTPLFSSGLLDSFALIDLVSFVERISGKRFGALDINLDNVDSIDRIIQFIERGSS